MRRNIYSALRKSFSLAAAIAFLSGCGGSTQNLTNGQTLTNLSGNAGTRNYAIKIPASTQSAIVEVSGSNALSIQILNSANAIVSDCPSAVVCLLHSPAIGTYTVRITATGSYNNASISAAWAGRGAASVLPGAKAGTINGVANTVGLNSVFVAENDTDVNFTIAGANATDLSLRILDSNGNIVTQCPIAANCTLSNASPGAYFIRHSTTSGINTLSLEGFVSLLDFDGVWVVTQSEVNARTFKTFLLALIRTATATNPATAIAEFEEEYGNFFPDCDESSEMCNDAIFFAQLRQLVDAALVSSNGNPNALIAALEAFPDVVTTGPLSECDAANQHRVGYWDATYNQGTRQYSVLHGETGIGNGRTDNGCTWLASTDGTEHIPATTNRTVTAGYLTNMVEFDSSRGSAIVVDGPDQMRIVLNEFSVEGTSVTLRRLSN